MKMRMLGSACLALTMLLAGVAAKAQELAAADKAKGLEYLEKTKKDLVEATKGLSEAQWNYKPAPDRWSVAQVMEHIALGEDGFQMMLNSQVMKGPAAPDRDLKKTDDAVIAMIPDRSHKAQAPEFLVPKNTFGSGETFPGKPDEDGGIVEDDTRIARSHDGQPDWNEIGRV
jgi:DinB superfamily